MSWQLILGCSMLLGFFGGVFAAIAYVDGWVMAASVFAGTALMFVFVMSAVYLISIGIGTAL